MAEQKESKGKVQVKVVIGHIIAVAVTLFLVAYHYFNWVEQVQSVSKTLDSVIRSVCILVIALEINRIVTGIVKNVKVEDAQKKTAIGLVVSMGKIVIVVVAIVMILTLFIEDTSSLFTGIGLLGMVIGLGCNKLIADIVAGIFIVLEGTYKVGDTVVINGTKGEIESVGIRTTRMLDKEHNLKIINNSSISSVTNNSVTNSGAMIELGIDYGEDIDRVEAIIKKELPRIHEELNEKFEVFGPFYKGVQDLGESAVILRFIAYADEDNRGKTRRKMNKLLYKMCMENNISIAYPHMEISGTIKQGKE